MSSAEPQHDFINILIKILTDYDEKSKLANGHHLSPEEFVKVHVCDKQLFVDKMYEKCIPTFFEMCSLRSFLEDVCKDDLLPSSPAGLVHIYLLLFYVSPSNIDGIVTSLFSHFETSAIENVRKYLSRDDLPEIVREKCEALSFSASRMENLAADVKDRSGMFQDSVAKNFQNVTQANSVNKICGIDFQDAHQMLSDYNKNPNPSNIDLAGTIWSPRYEGSVSKSKPSPSSFHTVDGLNVTKKISIDLSLPLGHQPEIKRARALRNIEEEPIGSAVSSNLSSCRTKAPREIKTNTAQVLREGARVQKKAEEAEKLFRDLCNGSVDPAMSTRMLKQVREAENAMELQEIERKHLLGLLSREEARIAKAAAHKANRMKALELKHQSQELEKQLQEWRRLEMIRMREIAERNQYTLIQARLAQVNLLNQKKQTAKQIQEESRELQKRIEEQKKRELDQKISLIRQIKELEQLAKASNGRDNGTSCCDNRSQTTSIGATCQMTIVQLKEALANLREQINEETQQRREKIQFEHLRQQKLLQDTMKRIQCYRNVPRAPKPKVVNHKELILTPDLVQLRRKLELKRLQAATAGRL